MSTNKVQAFSAISAYVNASNDATKALREAMVLAGFATLEEAEPIVTEWVATHYSCPLIEGRGKGSGRLVLDRSSPAFERAKRARSRLIEALRGDADDVTSEKAEREELDVPEHIAALAAKLVAACAEYEKAKKLASTAVANAFAAK